MAGMANGSMSYEQEAAAWRERTRQMEEARRRNDEAVRRRQADEARRRGNR